MTNARISELEHSAWSMFSIMGRGPGGCIVDTPTRLVIETTAPKSCSGWPLISPTSQHAAT